MTDVETLTHDALELPLEQRARLTERLISSLDDLSEEEAERLWAEEAIRRIAAYEAGHIEAHTAEAVHDAILMRLK